MIKHAYFLRLRAMPLARSQFRAGRGAAAEHVRAVRSEAGAAPGDLASCIGASVRDPAARLPILSIPCVRSKLRSDCRQDR
jgi:hypothetical protein